ncbi:hypothetical protein CYMTET_27515 [Cymbomonas tetramitiformis]|uniref:SLC26A/SulP transporter domain-containing protein n=1 Tax=Cymbomonas tetramitiformis TaxID=36881 RepID=A0AAE0FQ37_9CHLO|nr:hypothetical protein CYMTET_27515 [Cymbomonas tetramitiformis]|eukprot:gene11959-14130_t
MATSIATALTPHLHPRGDGDAFAAPRATATTRSSHWIHTEGHHHSYNHEAGVLSDGSAGELVSASAVVSTTLVTCALSTATIGLVLILIGHFKLARFVQYLPAPVIDGYLAFIGMYCLESSIVMMADIELGVAKFRGWHQLGEPRVLLLAAPGLSASALLFMVQRRYGQRHVALLPLMMFAVPAVFFVTVYFAGMSLSEARSFGWVAPLGPTGSIQDALKLYHFAEVQWGQVAKQVVRWIFLCFMVAFGSSLDVAAIEVAKRASLDYNRELQMVGLSNLVSGAMGGFTGSYIFSTVSCYPPATIDLPRGTALSILFVEWLCMTL